MTKADILAILHDDLKEQGHLSAAASDGAQAGDLRLDSLGFDSLDLLQFSVSIEEKIGVEIDVDDIPKDGTLSDVADLVLRLKHQ